jgi:Leucine-rich repeat (LRR) protein
VIFGGLFLYYGISLPKIQDERDLMKKRLLTPLLALLLLPAAPSAAGAVNGIIPVLKTIAAEVRHVPDERIAPLPYPAVPKLVSPLGSSKVDECGNVDFNQIALTAADKTIDFGQAKVADLEAFRAFLDAQPQLEQVDMYDTRLKSGEIDLLAARYPDIRFGWTIPLVKDHFVRTDATAYAINHNNRSETHSSEDFRQLKYCRDLMALDLGHNRIDDISFLEDLPKLRLLIISCNHIVDVSPLARLQDLEYVELFKNLIEDVRPLAKLEKLIDLNISHNRIKDLSPLQTLTGLERLWIYNANNYNAKNPVPPEQVEALQQALSSCNINSTSYSTLGGWRTHERYYVVFNVFHGAVAYLPWGSKGLKPRY